MLKNYFKIAWRNLLRNKLRTGIHILGLSIGIAICFLIFNVVTHSYSFDQFHPDGDRIYRVNTLSDWGDGGSFPNSGTPGPLNEVIKEEISGIEEKGKLYTMYNTLVTLPNTDKVFGRSNEVTFADPGFFKIFPRKWLAGNPETALIQPESVVISEASLHKYFPGSEASDVLGQELMYVDSDSIYASVTGVIADYNENTDFIFRDFISLSTISTPEQIEWYGLHDWTSVNSSSQLFVKLAQGVSANSVDEAFKPLISKNMEADDDGKYSTSFFTEPLSEMHFGQTYEGSGVSKTFLKGLIFIGLIILVLATLNFVNLETAQAIGRSKEVGIRKTIGGTRFQLISQFLAETFLIILVSSILALCLVEGLKVLFKTYLPQGFTLEYFSLFNLLFYAAFPVLLTLITGIYPALILSNYDPQRALKGEMFRTGKYSLGVFLRKNLTVIQLSSSIAFIILVLVLNYQLKFVTSQPLGFEKEAVMYASLPFMSDPDKMLQLQDRYNQEAIVQSASLSGSLVSSTSLWTSDVKIPVDTTEKDMYIQVMNVDSAFVKVNGIPLLAGTDAIDRADEILVNEQFVKEAGFASAEEAVGLVVGYSQEQVKIIGVVADFHSRSLREGIRPLLFTYNPEYFQSVNVKLNSDQNLAAAKERLEQIYLTVYPYEEASFNFLDAQIDRFYQEDVKIKNVLSFACGLAILISCLGLFGLSSFTIAQRTKEISIRKVLGATLQQILFLISKEYMILVGVSFLIAVFPAYYFLNDWLNGFNTRVDMPYLIFAAAGLGVMAICLLIVGVHSYVASQTNPGKVLKSE
ncbi:ABC-type antimicrobial peptide transport system, permease component [Algoriphagus locisalis]|uniref:ABC-type antimicrobial peptide transport system, permease component n=1 Tax=Algoriphagus locisalis TaxID=305507 RepID=A0A1I7E0N0_9BACT|nr:ABC transporter permease [Algoriphagus locisalis]SFU17471.1 ABC-type antimicrobial peptide transport system, permease component [Algoriphagus locisalis]